jgi:glycosyltransferase involved in cell wall biosynthesis
MKIAYFAQWDVSKESGVLKKIAGQMNYWQDKGHKVKLFALSPSAIKWEGMEDIPIEIVKGDGIPDYIFKPTKLFQKMRGWQPDLVYLRFSMYFPGLKYLIMSVPTVVEINSNKLIEYRRNHSYFFYLYHVLTRNFIYANVRGFTCITKETSDLYRNYNHPVFVIPNGIDLDQFPQLPPTNNSNPRLVFIGAPNQSWYGVDKMIWLAHQHPDWDFDLIGLNSDQIIGQVPENVTAHGYLNRVEYQSIMASSDIALGSLALERNNMNEGSTIKVREYLAYGIPSIIGYKDADFPEPVPFLLRLPSTEKNVINCLVEIENFVMKWMGKRVPRDNIKHLNITNKEECRLNFFKNILDTSNDFKGY